MEWFDRNDLLLKVRKTKEMVVDFRRKRTETMPMTIRGEDVDVVDSYESLGVHLIDRLDWSPNTDGVNKKMSRLYVLRKLRSFNVRKMLEIFYQSVVSSEIYLAVVCRGPASVPGTPAGSTD